MAEEADEDRLNMAAVAEAQPTQPVVKDYIADIFGADSDDEDDSRIALAPSRTAASKPSADGDELIEDSDDEDAPTNKKNSRLKKGGSQQKSSSSSSSSSSSKAKADDSSGDDDDDDGDDGDDQGTESERKANKVSKKSKRDERTSGRGEKKLKKRRVERGAQSGDGGEDADGALAATSAEGDEYDSGDEVQRTAEDDLFIDEDDDLVDIRGEYDAEDQAFDDERPEDKYRGKKPKKSAKSASSSSEGVSTKPGADDPFSKTLEAMKKPKAKEMSDMDKNKIVDTLLRQMYLAHREDEGSFARGEPAVHKLNMLKKVQSLIAVKILQHEFLEKDILGALRDWIEPKNDGNKTLPSLAVRTAVYEMLLKLPAQTDQLKRTDGDKKPIGHIILALRKHKMETPQNKRLLKEIMEKWCRPVFNKSADARMMQRDHATNDELSMIAAERVRRAAHAAALAETIASEAAERAGADNDASQLADGGGDLDAVLAGASRGPKDTATRARAPFSSGFLFTVRPEEKSIQRREPNEKVFGQTRATLMKKLNDGKKVGGTKANPRAMDMAMTGRNKS